MTLERGGAITAEGQLTFSEVIRFTYWYMWRRFRLLILLLCFVAFVYTPLAMVGVFGPAGKALEGKALGYLIAPLMLAFLFLVPYVGGKHSFASNKLLSQPVRFTFSSHGIDRVGPLSSATCKWEAIVRADESHSVFLLFFTKQQAYILPKRFFEDQSAVLQFRQLLGAQLGKRAKLRSGA